MTWVCWAAPNLTSPKWKSRFCFPIQTSFSQFSPSQCQLPSFHSLTPGIVEPSSTPLFPPQITSHLSANPVSSTFNIYPEAHLFSLPPFPSFLDDANCLPTWLSASVHAPTFYSQHNGQNGQTQMRWCHSSPQQSLSSHLAQSTTNVFCQGL